MESYLDSLHGPIGCIIKNINANDKINTVLSHFFSLPQRAKQEEKKSEWDIKTGDMSWG